MVELSCVADNSCGSVLEKSQVFRQRDQQAPFSAVQFAPHPLFLNSFQKFYISRFVVSVNFQHTSIAPTFKRINSPFQTYSDNSIAFSGGNLLAVSVLRSTDCIYISDKQLGSRTLSIYFMRYRLIFEPIFLRLLGANYFAGGPQ